MENRFVLHERGKLDPFFPILEDTKFGQIFPVGHRALVDMLNELDHGITIDMGNPQEGMPDFETSMPEAVDHVKKAMDHFLDYRVLPITRRELVQFFTDYFDPSICSIAARKYEIDDKGRVLYE